MKAGKSSENFYAWRLWRPLAGFICMWSNVFVAFVLSIYRCDDWKVSNWRHACHIKCCLEVFSWAVLEALRRRAGIVLRQLGARVKRTLPLCKMRYASQNCMNCYMAVVLALEHAIVSVLLVWKPGGRCICLADPYLLRATCRRSSDCQWRSQNKWESSEKQV